MHPRTITVQCPFCEGDDEHEMTVDIGWDDISVEGPWPMWTPFADQVNDHPDHPGCADRVGPEELGELNEEVRRQLG